MNFCPRKPEGDRPDRPAKGRPYRKRPRTGVLPDSHICARSRGIALPQPPALAKAGVTPAPEPATACTHRSVRPSAPLSPLSRVAAPAAYRGTAASSGKPFLRQAQHRLLRYAPLPAGAGNGATQDKGMAGRRRAPRPTQQGRRAPDTSRHEMYESGSPRAGVHPWTPMPPQPVENRPNRRGCRENRGWTPARGAGVTKGSGTRRGRIGGRAVDKLKRAV